MSNHRSQAAISLLAEMLYGLSATADLRSRPDPAAPDFSLDNIATDGTTVSTKIVMPTGDVYEVSVAWNAEESP